MELPRIVTGPAFQFQAWANCDGLLQAHRAYNDLQRQRQLRLSYDRFVFIAGSLLPQFLLYICAGGITQRSLRRGDAYSP